MRREEPGWFVAIGASGAEGLADIIDLLRALPKPVTSVVMVVLHRPRDGVSHLPEILRRQCSMPVLVASEGLILVRGTCYLGEPDKRLTLMARGEARLVRGAGDGLRSRTVDTLFDSLAFYAGRRAIGVVLSGSLDDGSRGLAAIHDGGGLTMVLDPRGKPRGMQQNAIKYGDPTSFIGTAGQIAEVVGRVTSVGFRR